MPLRGLRVRSVWLAPGAMRTYGDWRCGFLAVAFALLPVVSADPARRMYLPVGCAEPVADGLRVSRVRLVADDVRCDRSDALRAELVRVRDEVEADREARRLLAREADERVARVSVDRRADDDLVRVARRCVEDDRDLVALLREALDRDRAVLALRLLPDPLDLLARARLLPDDLPEFDRARLLPLGSRSFANPSLVPPTNTTAAITTITQLDMRVALIVALLGCWRAFLQHQTIVPTC